MARSAAARSDDTLGAGWPTGAQARAALAAQAETLAAQLLQASRAETTPDERARQRMLARLVDDPVGQVFTTALTDRIFRAHDPRRVVDQLRSLSQRWGLPKYMRAFERSQLALGRSLGPLAPGLIARAVLARVRSEARSVLLPAEAPQLAAFLAERRGAGVRVNVNQLGEALLGETEAEARVAKYAALARDEGVDALSVKVSSIGSQLNLLAFEDTVCVLAERIARIYAASLERGAQRPIVMLDMEAYQDVALTFEVLRRALRDPALRQVRAGMVLQAYLPDSNALLHEVCTFSAQRCAEGGEPLRLRLVKGANLAQERVDSAKTGLSLPIFESKLEVDANFKRLLERAAAYAHAGSITLGVGSHNLFDVAYALVLRAQGGAEAGAEQRIGIEMLEGMANDTVRALRARGVDVLVYAPICSDAQINAGIAYLVRRLDENTSNDNYLRSSFGMQPGDAAFERERLRFREAIAGVDTIDETPRRSRKQPSAQGYSGEPDTDFSRPDTRAWLRAALKAGESDESPLLCSNIAGVEAGSAELANGEDPSVPNATPYRIGLADAALVKRALQCTADDPSGFSRSSPEWRDALLKNVASLLRERRGTLIRALVMDGGKRVVEADAEVSEAIDFAEYYRFSYRAWRARTQEALLARGSVLVTPPWNFPLAIAAGGVFAALIAGNRVILKPALETPFVGAQLAQLIWDAGVPREALQLVICRDEVASALVEDPRIDSVILTGATETARLFQRMRPGLRLLAETGGKNAIVVSAMSDRELAIRDVVHSAFGHAGQKCSACSLLILEAEVYDDRHFRDTLADAVRSLRVGSAWEASSFVTPLIRPASGALLRALSQLEPGESWLVEPRIDPQNPRLVSPGVRLGVAPNSFMHTTELFGPVLSVLRADSLDHAIALVNASGYALTAGLFSLNEGEQARFQERVRAGNIYINRTITGAIVQRQPFGGFAKSGFGPGAKAGGPNYVAQLCRVQPAGSVADRGTPLPDALAMRLRAAEELLPAGERERLARFVADYAHARREHFGLMHDYAHVQGQDNLFGYRPREGVVLRVEKSASLFEALASCLAAELCGTPLSVSVAPDFAALDSLRAFRRAARSEPASELLHTPQLTLLRVLGGRSAAHDQLSSQLGAHVADEPVVPLGCLELQHYLREQSISVDYHRYGNLGARAQP